MKLGIQTFSILAATVLLAACASQSPYRPAEGRGFGYSEQRINEDHYRVHFKARGDDIGQGINYAMLRASEVALNNSFDWFTVVSRDTMVDRERIPRSTIGFSHGYAPYYYCNAVTCQRAWGPVTRYHTGINLGSGRSELEVILEVRMGRGERPETGESFNAREVFDNLRPVDMAEPATTDEPATAEPAAATVDA